MRILLTTLLLFSVSLVFAQETIEEIPYVRVLALDKSTKAAEQFNQEVSGRAVDFTLAFIDAESSPLIRYVYKTTKNETLRIDYKYVIESQGDGKSAKRTVVMQRINGPIHVLAEIYNFLFNSSVSPKTIMSVATVGAKVGHKEKIYTFTFQPDDYEPGYWVMTFIR